MQSRRKASKVQQDVCLLWHLCQPDQIVRYPEEKALLPFRKEAQRLYSRKEALLLRMDRKHPTLLASHRWGWTEALLNFDILGKPL